MLRRADANALAAKRWFAVALPPIAIVLQLVYGACRGAANVPAAAAGVENGALPLISSVRGRGCRLLEEAEAESSP